MGKMYRFFLTRVHNAIISIFLTGKVQHTQNEYATVKAPVLWIKNLLAPNRFFKRFAYGQAIAIPMALTFAQRPVEQPKLDSKTENWINSLKRDGLVVIPDQKLEALDKIIEAYDLAPENYPNDGGYNVIECDVTAPVVMDLATNETILNVLASYARAQPYLRHSPNIHVTFPARRNNRKKARKLFLCTPVALRHTKSIHRHDSSCRPLFATTTHVVC
jgi:hypothetical protein